MFSDPLMAKYMVVIILAIWGVMAVMAAGRSLAGLLIGIGVFAGLAYAVMGTGFSIRLPSVHSKMEVVVYTTHNNRVHALAHPLNRPGEPVHIVFSVDPATEDGARMRKSFFDAVRAREGKRYKPNIIIDMRGYMTEQGVKKYDLIPPLPPKRQSAP